MKRSLQLLKSYNSSSIVTFLTAFFLRARAFFKGAKSIYSFEKDYSRDSLSTDLTSKAKNFPFRSSFNNPLKTFLARVCYATVFILLLFAVSLNSWAEGTKQLEPTTPNAANGSLGLILFTGGWTAAGQRIPFATVGCAAPYRLNVYVSDPSTEIIYFGFKQSSGFALYYQLRDPDGLVVPGYALTSQPTVGNPGYIPNWNQAVAGPKFGVVNPTGYTPLVVTPTKVGNYYLEFAQDAAGNTNNMQDISIEYFDISVYQGNIVKPGRLWSEAWQFTDRIAGNHSPQTDFYILSNDSIVTKLNINRWEGGYFMFYCNHWGVINTGNWYTDRLSILAPNQASWPGDLPEFKIFLNDPDSLIFPTGSFGKICDLKTISKCDGSVDFLVKVNKPGKIELTIDVDPQGINNGEDIKLNADILGSPGCTSWDTIYWNGKDGTGQLLVNGATVNVNVDYLNGLTHLPIYDIETNYYGLMVDLVRPVPSGSSKLSIFWDDSQVPGCGPVCVNLTGCLYASAANACHNWPTNNQGNLVFFNSWWYYKSTSANTSPIIKRLPETSAVSPSGPSPVCVGQTNVPYTIPPILFAETYLWTLPNGDTATTATNSISLNFPALSSGGVLTVQGVNSNCGAGLNSPPLQILVNPTPVATATPSAQTICSGDTTSIALSSTLLNTTFTWTASGPGSVSGFSGGSGNFIAQILTNGSNAPHNVTYIITPVSGGCTGLPITVIVTVQPANSVNSLPLAQTICSGDTIIMNLTAVLPGTNFSWTVSGAGITGYSNGSGNVISQILFNNTGAPCNAVYLVTGTINGCTTTTTTYTVTVNNSPAQYFMAGGGSYCSGGGGVLVGLTNSQIGINYQLFSNGSPIGLPQSGTGAPFNFGNQTIAGTYIATATNLLNGCSSDMGNSVVVSINPSPVANAGADFTIPFGISTILNGSVSGGTPPINYTWLPLVNIASGANTTTPNTTNLYSATTFSLVVTDANGCTNTDQVTVSLSGSALNVVASASPNQICNDGSLTQLACVASGGSGVYSYTWTSVPAGSPAWISLLQNPWVSPGATTLYNVVVNDGYNTAMATVSVVVNPLPAQFSVTGGGYYCSPGIGVPVGIGGSQTNTQYQLFQGGVALGPPVAGTGNPISFGNLTSGSVYTVVATNMITGCVNTMSGSATVVVNPPLTIYKIDPTGQQCPGTIIRLNGSDLGVNYYLLLNGVAVDSIPGTGVVGFLDFGPRTANGTYTVLAVDMTTGCQAIMNGSTFISIAPQVFNVIPAGILCPGQMIILSGSETAVSYQLRWNGTFDLGAPVPGTGSMLNMGIGTLPGVYSVIAIGDTTNCVSYMNDSATLYPDPVLFSIVPDGAACEGDAISLNGSQVGVDYILLLDNAIHVDTIHGTGSALNFGVQLTAGNYTIIAVIQNSFCITQMNGVAVFNDSPVKYNLTPAGIVCMGNSIGLDGSQVGVSYQLLLNGTVNAGSPVAGTGLPISFGPQAVIGTYSVRAVNITTGCSSLMTGSVVLQPLPTVFNVAPAGNHCAGTSITLNGSELNLNYILVLNGTVNLDTLAGTGAALNFGPQITAGTYTVVTYSSSTFCEATMSGSSIIDARPILYNLTPSGVACSGDILGLDNSELGVNYQLRRNGIINVGVPVVGTGSAISFGIQTIAGIYTVEAAGSNGCVAIMNDSILLQPMPLTFTILPAGNHCPGTIITLNGSETGVNYVLFRDGIFAIDTLAGTGSALNFGTPMIAGTYSVVAYSVPASCQTAMNGNSMIMLSPTAFNVMPAGINCTGSTLGLDNSEIGVNYQLRRNGIVNVGAPVAGTGSAISFGIINIPGTYSIIGVSLANSCATTMTGNVILQPRPLIFTINPQGMQCAGTSVTLNGSQAGTDYVLVLDNTFNIDTISGTGSPLDFGSQLITGTYTILAIGGATTCQDVMNGATVIIALPAAFNVTPAGAICVSAVIGLDGSEGGAEYTLYKNGISTGLTIGGTGSPINFGMQAPGSYTVKAVDTLKGCTSWMSGTVNIGGPAVVNAGGNASVCSDATLQLNGTASLYSSVFWTTTGNGTFSNDTILNPVYTPGTNDLTMGTVSLVLNTSGTGACLYTSFTDTLFVSIIPIPTVNAGADVNVCRNSDYTVSGASAFNYTTLSWTTSGTGTFINAATLSPTYVPSAADLSMGSVILTLNSTGLSPCLNTASDALTMSFYPIVTANAGADDQVCAGNSYTIPSATATNYLGLSWSATGTGTFSNGNTFAATYFPGAADLAAGSVTLVLTAQPASPCAAAATDSLLLTFMPAAIANAGPDASSCSNGSYTVSGATAANYSSVSWATSGTGSFISNSALNPVYTPSPADITAGMVTLSLTVNGLAGCAGASDMMVLDFVSQPQVNAGTDAHMCTGPYVLSGASSTNCSSVNWTVSNGSGSLLNATTLTPTYTPSALDISNGFVELTLTGNPVSPCAIAVSDLVQLIIDKTPVVNAGADALSCQSANYSVNDANASHYTSLLWTSSGTGTFINATTLSPTYSPSAADLTAGTFTLTLTASNAGCGSVSDNKTVNIIGMPVVNAGPDLVICEGSSVTIGGASASTYSSINWATTGTGTFVNGNSLTPTYMPGAADLLTGMVTLTMQANALFPCFGSLSDQLILTIRHTPAVSAGNDGTVCSGFSYAINDATAQNSATVTWSTSGSGSFDNANALATTYTPGAGDIANGTVMLTLTGSNFPCPDDVDSKLLTIIPAVFVNAGPGALICNTCSYTITQATTSNASSTLWSSSGSGLFSNSATLNTVYTPSASDYATGSVILTLTAFGNSPCNALSDTLTLRFSSNPGVDFSWGYSCDGLPVSFFVNTQVTNVADVASWHWDFGDGSTSAVMDPVYLYAAPGQYTVTLTIVDLSGSTHAVIHQVFVSQIPVSYFKYSTPNCSNQSVQFTDLSHTLYGYISKWIWSYGDGTPGDTIVFPADPNLKHDFDTAGVFNVTLTITNSFGCIASVTVPVQVIPAPITNFNFTNNCLEANTSFQDASYANGPGNIVEWWWDFGDPATGLDNFSNLMNPEHKFSAPGTYLVTHVVRNYNNCTDTIVKPVVILPATPVDFTFYHTCIDENTHFVPDTSVMILGNIASWYWEFGDGGISYLQSPVHSYTTPGSYQVSCTITDLSGCTASRIRTVVVNPLPVAMFNFGLQRCKGVPVEFRDVSATYTGNVVKWVWDFGDGNTQTVTVPGNPNVEHTYAASGNFTVTLTITASDSCTSTQTQALTIESVPSANFSVENTCQGTPSQFTDLTQTGGIGTISGWLWNFGDPVSGINNESTIQNPTHNYASNGSYQVTLSVQTSNGCSGTVVQTVVVSPAPAVDFYSENHCAGSAVQFHPASSVNTANVATWLWNFGDGLTGNTQDPAHIYTAAGNYLVTLTITDLAGCANTISHTINIVPQPFVVFSYNQPACSQSLVHFTSNSSASVGYIMRWEWNFGDGTTQTVNYPDNPNVMHQYNGYGNYNVTLNVITNDSCSNSLIHTVTILQSPLANFNFEGNCIAHPVQFDDISQGSVISWNWSFGDPLSGSSNVSTLQNPLHTFNQAGNYAVTLVVNATNNCSDTIVKMVPVEDAPAVNFSYNNGCASDTVMFQSSAFVNVPNTASWLWQFGDNSTSAEVDPGHIYANPGTYTVTLTITNLNGCTNTKVHQVQVTAAPIAQFSVGSQLCSNNAVLFNDNSSTSNGVISSWYWDFGDGSDTLIQAPANPDISHVYSGGGSYTVTHTIHTSTGCENTLSTTINVNSAPLAAYSYTGNCSGQASAFTDLSQPSGTAIIAAWNWNFGDPNSGVNNTSSTQSPYHQFSAVGTYNVLLTVINSNGCTDTSMQVVTIVAPPAVEFLHSYPSCDGSAVTFNADTTIVIPSTVSAYSWDFGDGTAPSTMASPSHQYASAGDYTVTLTIDNLDGCENAVSHVVAIHTLPVAMFTTHKACGNNITQFTDQSYSPDGTPVISWSWDFGVQASTGDTASIQNPTFGYPSTGIYNVTLTVTSYAGCTTTSVIPVNVIPAPQAQFQYTAEPCHNGSVVFQDMSTSAQSSIASWYWEFAPGSYSTLRDPVYVFGNTDTSYLVKLVVTNTSGCTDTLIKQVYIPGGMKIAINNTATCVGATTWFTSNILEPVGDSLISFAWNFGDPATGFENISYLRNPSHTFSKSGPFVVTLEATDIHNCTKTVHQTVMIAPYAQADFSAIGGACDAKVSFTDKTTGATVVQWTWDFGDGTSATVSAPANPDLVHNYPYPGIYVVTLTTLSNGGCTSFVTDTIRRLPCIHSNFAIRDTVVCQNRTMYFSENSTCQAPIASWTWDFGDNTIETFTTQPNAVSHLYSQPGNYIVKLIISTNMVGGAVTDTSSRPVGVNPAPEAGFSWKNACIGNATPFINSTNLNGSQLRDFKWKFGDPQNTGATSTQKNPVYLYPLSGEYNVNLVAASTLGCTDTLVQTVSIYAMPKAGFTWANNCEGKPVYFTDATDTASARIKTWNWYFNGESELLGASTQQNPSFAYSKAGIYNTTMAVIDENGCSDTIIKQVAINSSPVAAFSIGDNYENIQGQVKFINGTMNGNNYFWDFGNGKTSYSESPVVTYDQDGRYTVKLTAWNGQDCADTLTMDYTLAFKGLYVPNAFSPENTAQGVTIFKPAGLNLKKYYIEVIDRWGNKLWSSDKLDSKGSPAEGWDGTVNHVILPEGAYMWRASAIFIDGTYWDGHNVGINDNMPQSFTGTVTLIR